MVKGADEKILRLGVIRKGKIVEERLLRKKQDVSFGSNSRNTIVLSGTGIPKSKKLLALTKSGDYRLETAGGVEGKLVVDGKVHKISGESKAKNAGIVLTAESRGKVVVGDVTFLFQFVAPPNQVSRPQLPAVARSGISAHIDLFLTGILFLSLILQGGTVGGLHFWWETTGKYEVEERPDSNRLLAALVVEVEEQQETEVVEDKKEDEEEKEEEVAEPERPEPEPIPEPEKKVVKKEAPKPEEKVEKPKETNFSKRREKVIDATILKFVTSQGEGGSLGLTDTLKDGATAKSLEDAWETTGVRVADSGEDAMFRGGPQKDETAGNSYRKLDSKDVKGPTAGSVKTSGKQEAAIKGSVGMRSGSVIGGTGKMDKGSVADVIKKRKSAIRKCYESALRTNSKVAGKVVIEFTVGPRGRVTDVGVKSNSTGDKGVGDCIAKRLKGWKFPKPENGSVTFSYPFVLSKAN